MNSGCVSVYACVFACECGFKIRDWGGGFLVRHSMGWVSQLLLDVDYGYTSSANDLHIVRRLPKVLEENKEVGPLRLLPPKPKKKKSRHFRIERDNKEKIMNTNGKSVVHPIKAVPIRINVVNRNVCAQ